MKAKITAVFLLMGVAIMSLLSGCEEPRDKAYQNEQAGWQIAIPESWEGHYQVVQNKDGAIDFYFIGQSEFCRKDLYTNDNDGLYFFSITDKTPVSGDVIDYSRVQWLDMFYADFDPDAQQKSRLGAINGVDYYIALRTSYIHNQEHDWGIGGINRLFLIDEKGSYINRKTAKREVLEPNEFTLVKTDISKVQEMTADLERKVRESFKSIEITNND